MELIWKALASANEVTAEGNAKVTAKNFSPVTLADPLRRLKERL